MTKLSVYQIDRDQHPEAARDAFMYGKGNIFTRADAANYMRRGVYRKVADVEAVNMEHVYELMNLWPQPENWIKRLAPLHSLSVGDVVVSDQTKSAWIVAGAGFDYLDHGLV